MVRETVTGPQRPESREPGTEAGRALLGPSGRYHFDNCGVWAVRPCSCGLADGVLAIEAEARAAERTGLREALLRILDLANLPLDEMRQRHGSEQRVLMAVIPSIVDAALTADPPEPPATGPVPTPEAPTAASGPRDGSEGSGR